METAEVIEQVNALISQGEKFDFADRYDYATIIAWIERAGLMLADFEPESGQFRLYCAASYWFPSERVSNCLEILKSVRRQLQNQRDGLRR